MHCTRWEGTSECVVCTETINNAGACTADGAATAQTNNGAVACSPGMYAVDGACASCDAFGAGCESCSGVGCDACPEGTIAEAGRCVASAHGADADGTRCDRCADGQVLQTDTTCVADGCRAGVGNV